MPFCEPLARPLSPSELLSRHIPPEVLPYCLELFRRFPFEFKVRKKRLTKAGDFCAASGKRPVITVNDDLPPLLFLVTFIHEVSHHIVYLNHGHRVEPHGQEWKSTFQSCMAPVMNLGIFPDELQDGLAEHLINPRASTFTDSRLTALFRKYEGSRKSVLVNQFRPGEVFVLRGRRYRMGLLRRTRFACIEMDSGRLYLVPGDMEVDLPPEITRI